MNGAERALQPRQRALQHDEPGAGHLRRRLEVHQAQRLADLEVLLGLDVASFGGSPTLRTSLLSFSSLPTRHLVERQVGNDRQRIAQRLVELPLAPPRPLASSSLSAATSAISFAAPWPRPSPPWPCRSPSTPRCAAPAPPAAASRARGAPRPARSARADSGASPRFFSPASNASGLSRIHLMSNMGEPSGSCNAGLRPDGAADLLAPFLRCAACAVQMSRRSAPARTSWHPACSRFPAKRGQGIDYWRRQEFRARAGIFPA